MKVRDQKSVTTPAQAQQLLEERKILTFAENPFITSMARSIEKDKPPSLVMDNVKGNNASLSWLQLFLALDSGF